METLKHTKLPPSPSPDKYYDLIINEAPYIKGTEIEIKSIRDIQWLNPELVKQGTDFARRNYMALYSTLTSATLLGLSFKSITSVLLRHGDIYKSEFAFRRHLSGIGRALSWMNEDILSDDEKLSKGIQNFYFVQKTHQLVFKNVLNKPFPKLEEFGESSPEKIELLNALREDMKFIQMDPPMELLTWDPKVPLSQFDMVATMFAAIGPIFLYPEKIGFDLRGLEGFLHLEAITGKMMGLEDRFNLGLHASHEFCEKFFYNTILSNLKFSDEITITLQEAFLKGTFESTIFSSKMFSPKVFMQYGLKSSVPNFEGKNLCKTMTVKEKIGLIILQSSLWMFNNLPFGRSTGNILTEYYFRQNYGKYVDKSIKL